MVPISQVVYYGSSIPLLLMGDEIWPTNAAALVSAADAAQTLAEKEAAAAKASAAEVGLAHPVTAWLDNLENSINNAMNDVGRTLQEKLALNSFSRINSRPSSAQDSLPPAPSQLQKVAATAVSVADLAATAAKAAGSSTKSAAAAKEAANTYAS
jgi:hypothetical protein